MSDLRAYASPYNRFGLSTVARKLPATVEIHDLTLEGDGEEMAGVMMSESDRIAIALRLCAIGVKRMTILGNSPMPSPSDIRCAGKIVDLNLPVRLGAFVKTIEEIDLAARLGLAGVDILVGVNDSVLPQGESGADIIGRSLRLAARGRSHGLHVCLMGMDATRTRPQFLEQVITRLDGEVDEFCIGDSMGVISPWGLQHLLGLVTSWTKRPLQVHLHNHSSVAVANALAAVLAGVATIQTTVNGLGELTGLVPLEGFAVAALIHLGVDTGISLGELKGLSDLVAGATGGAPHRQAPVVGEAAFAIPETEEIQQAFWHRYEEGRLEDSLPYPPRLVGNDYQFSIGRRISAATVRYHLAVFGFTADNETIQRIAAAAREKMESFGPYGLMSDDAFRKFIDQGDFALTPYRRNRSDFGDRNKDASTKSV